MKPDHDVTRTVDPSTATGDAVNALRDLLTQSAPTAGAVATAGVPDPPPGFVIEKEIGVGGMGIVYLARQAGLNRPVALKLVKSTDKVDAKALIRFLAEAEAVASIKHPNVVEVYQYGDHQGRPYMALEYCPGGDLTTLSKAEQTRDAAWFRQVADLMAQVADGVNAAHAQGIVHRDLKPHNVFLTADGTPKVADFGLAKRGIGSDLTNTQSVMGTPAYMSPEQAGGGTKFVGPEADVWALGVMLYELCCGSRPINTSGPLLDAIARVARGKVSLLRTKAPTVPPDLALIAHKCLSRDPRDRYPTANGLASDLRNWLDGKPISARPAGAVEQAVKWAKRNRKLAGMGLAVLLTMATATAVSLGFGFEAARQEGLARQKANELTQAETDSRQKASDLGVQLKETRRVLDLSRLFEANTAWERKNSQLARNKLAQIAPENRCIAWGLLNRHFEGSDLTLYGHTNRVMSVAFSPDGRRIVTGSADNTARVWDAATGQSVLELKGHPESVTGAAFSPDGARVVTVSENAVRMWDAFTGQSMLRFEGHERMCGIAFSPDGRRIVTGTLDKTVRVWDAVSGQSLLELRKDDGGHGMHVAFSPDGRRVVTGGMDRARGGEAKTRVWDANSGQCMSEWTGLDRPVLCVGWSPEGTRIVTSSLSRNPQVWDAATNRTVLVLQGHTDDVGAVGFSPDGRRVVTGSFDTTARVWDMTTGQTLVELKGHTGGVSSVAFSPDGRRIVTGSADNTARVWDADTGQTRTELNVDTYNGVNVALSPDGTRIVTGSRDTTTRVWDTVSGQNLLELKGDIDSVQSVAFSPDGARIVTGGVPDDKPGEARQHYEKPGEARIWDAVTGQTVVKFKGHSGTVRGVAFSPDGRRVVTGSWDKTARVWDAATGKSVLELKGHAGPVTGVAFSPDGRRVVTWSGEQYWSGGKNYLSEKSARVWDTTTGHSVLELTGHTDAVTSVAFSPDGARIATGSRDRTVKVWDAATGQSLTELTGHTAKVTSVAFSPDGRRVFTGSSDRTVRVWDAGTWQNVAELAWHTHEVSQVVVSPDGLCLITSSLDRRVRLWDASMAPPRREDLASSDELVRRRSLPRPRPEVHAKLAEDYKDDWFASAVQKSLEQNARGRLAMEAGHVGQAIGHFLAAELLRPKPDKLSPPPEKK